MDQPFTRGELESALQRGKTHTAPGPDKITMTMLRNLPDLTKSELLEWINEIWETGKLPKSWKHSLVIPIPKPGKDKGTLTNYRPISLTSCTCKIMECMVLSRIEWFLESNNSFHPAQTGFRPGIGTQESLALISADIIRNINPDRSNIRTIITVDVRKAFDSVPHSTIIKESQRLGITGRSLNFIKTFLEGRTFSVRCGANCSEPKANPVGVPQGSVISPMLFNIVMAALPYELEKINKLGFTMYADDVSIWTKSEDIERQQDTLQAGLDMIEAHLHKVGLQASPDKTNMKANPALYVCEDPGNYRKGDRQRGHIWLQDTLKYCNSALNAIRRICSAKGGATDEIARRTVKAMVVSRVCYGARHYWLTKAQWRKLESLNNQAMRIITGLPRFTPLGKLKEHAQINSLHDTVVARTVAHGERLKHFKQGREILKLLWRATELLPNLPEQLPPWEDHMNIAENKPTARRGDSQQQARIAKAHSRMVETWTNPTHIMAAYTDTAAEDSPVPLKTAAVYFPALGSSAANALPMRTSIKGGELAAIHLALETVLKSQHPLPRELRVFSDSREAIKECQKARSPSRIVREIKKLASRLLQEGTTTKISWVPAHAGIEGNEEAHQQSCTRY
ncbi:uncharacterized protein ISCGN_031105 [Ixodes scapularis]